MKHALRSAAIIILFLSFSAAAQVPVATQVAILKAEDARIYDKALESLLTDPNEQIRERAAWAAGRIGDEAAIEPLAKMLANDRSTAVRAMAAFAIGEIESIKSSDAILAVLSNLKDPNAVTARAVEAAGKIAAANAKDERAKALGAAIVEILTFESGKRSGPYEDVILAALTAALRARPEGAEAAIIPFLGYSDAAIVADALNTLSRLRAKTANAAIRKLLETHTDPVVRANAARALGAAEDKDSVEILIKAATEDTDSRVRVSAIRSLAWLKEPGSADVLLERGNRLLGAYRKALKPNFKPNETNELLEIAAALGRLLQNTADERAVKFLTAIGTADKYRSPETEIAFARIAPAEYVKYLQSKDPKFKNTVKVANASLQGIREFASLNDSEINKSLKTEAVAQLRQGLSRFAEKAVSPTADSIPEVLASLAAFKPEGLDAELRLYLIQPDVFIRTSAAGLLADLPPSIENVDALKKALAAAFTSDKHYNDAQLAIIDALFKLDKNGSVDTLFTALNASDYLVRKKAFDLLGDGELQTRHPDIVTALKTAREKHKDAILPYQASLGTKLGQLLNSDADYRRAALRKNGEVKAILTTAKGTFTIDLWPEDAPLTVDNFVKLANAKYFNGLEVHRVVANFVMQDGDPRGDGNGGPGWSIRCEVNMIPYERGAVGMALSGKDTGGSQWFATHSRQPHLDGGYTVFGKVNEAGMKIVDNIVRGDTIISVKIVEQRTLTRVKK